MMWADTGLDRIDRTPMAAPVRRCLAARPQLGAGGVFISYRAADSCGYAAMLYRELSQLFGADLVFLDSESIPAGADFVEVLVRRLRGCRVLLAVVGPRWLAAADPAGRRQIDDSTDWVRRELVTAFTAGLTVIPVLIDDVDIPAAVDLPPDIAAFSRRQYRRLRHRDVSADLLRIVADLAAADPVLAAAARRPPPPSRPAPA